MNPAFGYLKVEPRSTLEFTCAYCGRLFVQWQLDENGQLVSNNHENILVTDGDTVFGVAEAIGYDESKPWDWELGATSACPHCKKESVILMAGLLSDKYGDEARLQHNGYSGEPECFKVILNQEKIAFDPVLRKKLKHWKDYGGCNDGLWNMIEYKTQALHPMQRHFIGPLRANMDAIKGPNGVAACSSDQEWQLYKEILVELWDTFRGIAAFRQELWEREKENGHAE